MAQDLRLHNVFTVSKDIFSSSPVSRKAMVVYIALCYLITQDGAGRKELPEISGYNLRAVREALNELVKMGFIKKNRKHIDLVK